MPYWKSEKIEVTEICPVTAKYCKIVFNNRYVEYVGLDDEICMGSYEGFGSNSFVNCYYKIKSFTYNAIELEFLRAERFDSYEF